MTSPLRGGARDTGDVTAQRQGRGTRGDVRVNRGFRGAGPGNRKPRPHPLLPLDPRVMSSLANMKPRPPVLHH